MKGRYGARLRQAKEGYGRLRKGHASFGPSMPWPSSAFRSLQLPSVAGVPDLWGHGLRGEL